MQSWNLDCRWRYKWQTWVWMLPSESTLHGGDSTATRICSPPYFSKAQWVWTSLQLVLKPTFPRSAVGKMTSSDLPPRWCHKEELTMVLYPQVMVVNYGYLWRRGDLRQRGAETSCQAREPLAAVYNSLVMVRLRQYSRGTPTKTHPPAGPMTRVLLHSSRYSDTIIMPRFVPVSFSAHSLTGVMMARFKSSSKQVVIQGAFTRADQTNRTNINTFVCTILLLHEGEMASR